MAIHKLLRSLTPHKRPKPAALVDGRLALNAAVESPGLYFKNAGNSLVKIGPVHVGPTAPNSTPAANGETGNCTGEDWLDTSVTPPVRRTWTGTTWEASLGPTGPAGPKGDTGAAGSKGDTGNPGPTAVSANAGNLSKLGTDGLLLTAVGEVSKFFVAITGTGGAANIPAGATAQRPSSPQPGQERWNTELGYMEVYTGADAGWQRLAFVRLRSDQQDLTYTANTTLSGGVYACRNLTINAGVTITAGSQALIFLCSGNATINGSIVADAKGPLGGPVIGGTGFLQPSAGSGAGAGNCTPAGFPYVPMVSIVGSGGSSGYANTAPGGYVTTSPGGRGGGCIGISAQGTITLGSSALLSAKGDNAGAPSGISGNVDASGGGGGSGGSIILNGFLGLRVAGTLNVRGGNGANAVGTHNGHVFGGAAGGGGVVLLQTVGTLVNTASVVLDPGTAGTSLGTVNIRLAGGGGGSFGGRGGSDAAYAASPGVLLNCGSPF